MLAKTDLTFDMAMSIAAARETASKDMQAMTSGSVIYIPGSQSGDKKHKQNLILRIRIYIGQIMFIFLLSLLNLIILIIIIIMLLKHLVVVVVGYIGNVIVLLKTPLAMIVNKKVISR